MNIFHIQDTDRPMYVVAENWQAALDMWKTQIADENDETIEEVSEPQGIALLCEGDDLLILEQPPTKWAYDAACKALHNQEDIVRWIRTEMSCRIDHGAETGGHLEALLKAIDIRIAKTL